MEDEEIPGPIMMLPDEVIGIILQNAKCRDIINFGATCKQFNEFVSINQYIWKEKFREILPHKISDIVEKYGDGNWLEEIKRFYIVKHQVYDELMTMSPKYYWRTSSLSLEDVGMFISLATKHSLNYNYVIFVLQDIIKIGNGCIDENFHERPYTLTDVYYAKVAVRFLIQSFLAVKWMQSRKKKELTPDIVVNFFVQWTDPVNMHSDDNVKACINMLVEKVENMFPNDEVTAAKGCYNIKEKLAKGLLNEKQVLEAVSDVIFRQHHLTIMAGASLNGLDIVKVFHNKCGNLIVAAVIYQAVARGCGVHCELIAFPNHLFLEWRTPSTLTHAYRIDLETGDLVPQGRCPFAPSTFREEYKYNPDGFVQYIVTAFLMTMGAIKNSYTQNALFLLDFLNNNPNDENPYRDFQPYLDAVLDLKESHLDLPLQIEYVHECHMNMIFTLATLNAPPTQFTREGEVKYHAPEVKFAVGMLAYHKKYDYLCVVRGWDLKCTTDWRRRVEYKDLEFGAQQPFYSVTAVDQSDRYVAQENLIHVERPTRLYHLEDTIAKEFSYFDGFCYIPNPEKNQEYPQDEPIRKVYRDRALHKIETLREAI